MLRNTGVSPSLSSVLELALELTHQAPGLEVVRIAREASRFVTVDLVVALPGGGVGIVGEALRLVVRPIDLRVQLFEDRLDLLLESLIEAVAGVQAVVELHLVRAQRRVVVEDGQCLTLVGETSIAHTLFTEPARVSGGVPHQFLEVMDFMISFRFNQSDTERAGRTMTLTKPALRSSLGNVHFKQAAWVAFNSPGFHEIDVMALVRRWKADGHLSAVMKDASGPRAKEVLERKAQEHKVSLLH